MLLVSRNNPENHAMLKQVLGCESNSQPIKKVFFNKIYVTDCPGDEHLVLCDDPIAFIYARIFHHKTKTHIRLWALQLWQHQVVVKGLKTLIRYFIFSIFARISYFLCDSILIPSETRRLHLYRKHPLSKLKFKSKVILNIPELSSENSYLDSGVYKKFAEFRAAYKTVLIYAGSLQVGRLLEDLLRGENLSKDIGILVCGSGSMEAKLRLAEKTNAGLLFLGNLDQSGLTYVYQHSDIGLLTYDNKLLNTRMCAPLKLWEYMFFNLTIVGNENEALLDEWSKYVDGYFGSVSDINALVEGMCRSSARKIIPSFDYKSVIEV